MFGRSFFGDSLFGDGGQILFGPPSFQRRHPSARSFFDDAFNLPQSPSQPHNRHEVRGCSCQVHGL